MVTNLSRKKEKRKMGADLGEEDEGTKLRRNLPQEAAVVGKPFNVALVSAVHENGSGVRRLPVLRVDQVALREAALGAETEVIDDLREILHRVRHGH